MNDHEVFYGEQYVISSLLKIDRLYTECVWFRTYAINLLNLLHGLFYGSTVCVHKIVPYILEKVQQQAYNLSAIYTDSLLNPSTLYFDWKNYTLYIFYAKKGNVRRCYKIGVVPNSTRKMSRLFWSS